MNKLILILLFTFLVNMSYAQPCTYKGVEKPCWKVEALKELDKIDKEFDYKIRTSGGGKNLDSVMKEFKLRVKEFKRKYKLK